MDKMIRSEIAINKFEREVEERAQFAPAKPFANNQLNDTAVKNRRDKNHKDFWYFDKIYFTPDMYSGGYSAPSDFHKDLLKFCLENNAVNVILGPRGYGKTSQLKKIFTWLLLEEKIHYAGVMSSTLPSARNIMRDVVDLLLTNPRILNDYKFEIIENNADQFTFRLKGAKKSTRINTFSEGRSVRGATKLFDRPEFILVDDIETRNSPISEEHSMERARVLSEAFNSMAMNGAMIVLGNNFHEKSLMNILKLQQEQGILNDKWHIHIYKAFDGKPLWPARFPANTEDELRALHGAFDESEWQADYQQNPVPADGFIFKRHTELPIWENLPGDIKAVVYCDPNLAKKGKGDTTAIVCYGYSAKNDKYYIIDLFCHSISDSNELLDIVLSIAQKRSNIYGIAWDGNVNQESVWTQFVRNWCQINNMPFPHIEYRRYNVDDLAKNVQGIWNSGKILFPLHHLYTDEGKRFLQQIYSFAGKKAGRLDDAPDALICANEFLHERHLGQNSSPAFFKTIKDFFSI